MLDLFDVVGAGLFGVLGAAAVVAGLLRWGQPPDPAPRDDEVAVFLFAGRDLVDANAPARRLLRGGRSRTDLDRLIDVLAARFGSDLGARLAKMPPGGHLVAVAPGGMEVLEADDERGTLRLTLRSGSARSGVAERVALDSAERELRTLRGIAEDAPHPIWAVDASGALTWANRVYLDLADRMAAAPSASEATPAPQDPRLLWPQVPILAGPSTLAEGEVHRQRLSLAVPGCEDPLWYDVTTVRRGTGTLHFGTDVGGLVLAEAARLHFVQALAKTFAHLATGLAIFDRERRLVLFNPAFMDMTGLPVAFLSSRPLVQAVLDRLRDARILPEPRDYASWREEVTAVAAAAVEGHYRETWTLPDGRTWRVTGRPHPDGALAFLFEDVSVEIGQARRSRSEIEGLRAALAALDEPVALFGSTGALQGRSAAYDQLWGAPDEDRADLRTEIDRWQAACGPSPLWDALRAAPGPSRAAEEGLASSPSGSLKVRVTPLPRGAVLVGFGVQGPPAAAGALGAAPHPDPAEAVA